MASISWARDCMLAFHSSAFSSQLAWASLRVFWSSASSLRVFSRSPVAVAFTSSLADLPFFARFSSLFWVAMESVRDCLSKAKLWAASLSAFWPPDLCVSAFSSRSLSTSMMVLLPSWVSYAAASGAWPASSPACTRALSCFLSAWSTDMADITALRPKMTFLTSGFFAAVCSKLPFKDRPNTSMARSSEDTTSASSTSVLVNSSCSALRTFSAALRSASSLEIPSDSSPIELVWVSIADEAFSIVALSSSSSVWASETSLCFSLLMSRHHLANSS
mmetsp:Transcript_38591/g.94675  ORF Transcript_38591/g.94675 Transcript_38591/m.94675 type:complete len:276 (-) Transcript_38591:211-1038(-)